MSFPAAKSYTVIGAAFGCCFPLVGTVLTCWRDFGRLSLAGFGTVQSTEPLLWIIDTAPLFLGLVAAFAGSRQDHIAAINHSLEDRVAAQTESLQAANAALAEEVECRKTREEELVSAYEEATATTRAKDLFVSRISHELRTPLNGIIGMADEVLDTDLTKAQRESLSILRYSAQNLLIIINDILDLAKAAANKLALHPRDFSPAELLQSIQASVRTKVAEKGLFFQIREMDPIPTLLHGDPVRISQILLNLVGNAVKFTDQGSVSVEVRIPERTATACTLEIRVIDTGIGISAEHQQQLFEDFAQAHAEITPRYGGTGLGLAITRKLVELQSGELTLQSTPGVGSQFTFRVPLLLGQTTLGAIVKEPSRPPLPTAPANDTQQVDMRVLLVEDHPVNQVVATAFLKRYGLPFDLAENGVDAVRLAETNPYDLILMDIHLPLMDGLEATRRIRASTVPHTDKMRIIALTASALKEEAQACLDAGMDAFVAKPFKPKDLYRTIVEVMRKPA